MAKATKCKKKARNLSAYEKELKVNRTFQNKLRKLEKQVAANPNDHIAAYNLAVFRKDGIKAKGYSGN